MCRNITLLFNFEPPATDDEIRACARQYVRKVSGMREPSMGNKATYEAAVAQVEEATRALVRRLVTTAHPHNRDDERLRAHERGIRREQRLRERLAMKP